MKKLFKKKWFLAVIIVILIIGGFILNRFFGDNNPVEYTTEIVKRGKLIQTVTATGAVESAHDISLNFKTTGRLVYLKVDEGDRVKTGAFLAQLDAVGLSAQVEQYRANLKAVQADLEKVKAGASQEDIKVFQEKAVKAENDLKSLEAERDDELKTLREKTLNALNNAVSTALIALDTVYNYLLNNNTTNDLQFYDNGLADQVENSYNLLKKDFTYAQTVVSQANRDKSNESIISAADELRNFLLDLNSFLDNSFNLADKVILNNTYTQTKKDTIKSDISGLQTTNNTSLNSLQTAKSNLATSISDYNSQIQAAGNNLAIYQAQLDLEKAGPRDFEIQSAAAKVVQARAQLDKALADLGDYVIRAPISGTITKVNFNVGEQTNLSEPAIEMLSTENFEVKVDIPESDIAKIKIGDQAVIELDAFGSDHPFSGTVSFIDPAQTIIQDVTYYQTTISFNSDVLSEQIKPGMTADVTVITAEKDNILYIPQRAIKLREASLGEVPQKYVQTLVAEQKVEEKIIAIGLRGDNGLVEVVSGLNEGEKVVTFQKNGK